MAMIKTKGIVVSSTQIGENDKLLTLFTDKFGAISVSAKGVTSRHNNLKAATGNFCFSDFVLYDKKNGYYTISEASPITDFMGLSSDINRFEEASKIVKFVKYTAVENEDSEEMLILLLNTLHMFANTSKNTDIIKAVYYLKALKYMGIPPVTKECAICGIKERLLFFAPQAGGTVCPECGAEEMRVVSISEKTALFMDYIISAPLKSAFGVNAENEVINLTLDALNVFLKEHLSYNM